MAYIRFDKGLYVWMGEHLNIWLPEGQSQLVLKEDKQSIEQAKALLRSTHDFLSGTGHQVRFKKNGEIDIVKKK